MKRLCDSYKLAVLALLLAGAACAPRVRTGAAPLDLLPPPASVAAPYILQAGDLISVKFYYNADLNEDILVRPDGMISLALIGDVQAAGQSPGLLATELTKLYTGELANPKVNVIVRELAGSRVYVGGEVGEQGLLPLGNGLTLFQAIQQAGGFLPSAHRAQVVLIRRNGSEAVGYAIDTRPVASGEDPGQDVVLRPYDTVYVPRSKIASVNLFVEQYIRNLLPISPIGFIP